MRRPYWIPNHAGPNDFPPLENALEHPDGLLAIGGDLSPKRLIEAYRKGIFPWYSDDQPILWWSPSQRMVLFPEQLNVSRSLNKTIRKQIFTITLDQNFREVVKGCAGPRRRQHGTWITQEMLEAYCQLHKNGYSHSVECWYDNKLVGGLYGTAIGKVFFGESMFSHATDASKVAFAKLVQQLTCWGYELIDCQVHTNHLATLGAKDISREYFRQLLDTLCELPGKSGKWVFD